MEEGLEELPEPFKKFIAAFFGKQAPEWSGEPLFKTGTVIVTRTIDLLCKRNPPLREKINSCMARHVTGDCGEMSENDKVANFAAIMNGRARIHSSYSMAEVPGKKIWIITEYNRKLTTIQTPNE